MFPKRLRDTGYDTALFGKLHVSGIYAEADGKRHANDGFAVYEWPCDPFGPWGLDNAYLDWLDERNPEMREALREKLSNVGNTPVESHMTTWAAERPIDFLSRRGPGKISTPFFCCMSVFDPHSPYVNHPKEMEDLLDIPNLPAVVASDQPFDGRPIAHEMEHKWGPQVPVPDTLTLWRIGYHAGITNIDLQVGRVLEALESQGLADETVVIFTSDHGDMMGDHGLMTKGAYFYDACTRVPMIVRNPDAKPAIETSPVQWHDIAGTCLQIAGQSADETRAWSQGGVNILDSAALEHRNRAVCLYRNSGVCTKREEGLSRLLRPAHPRHDVVRGRTIRSTSTTHRHRTTRIRGEKSTTSPRIPTRWITYGNPTKRATCSRKRSSKQWTGSPAKPWPAGQGVMMQAGIGFRVRSRSSLLEMLLEEFRYRNIETNP